MWPPETAVSRRTASASARGDHGAMPVIFRRGTDADARAAADLWLRARKAAIDVIPPPVHRDDEVRAWFASHVVRNTELWVAEDPPGALVGILVLDGPWSYTQMLWTGLKRKAAYLPG
jgi:hypothetical protein